MCVDNGSISEPASDASAATKRTLGKLEGLSPEVAPWITEVLAELDPSLIETISDVQLLRDSPKLLATVTHAEGSFVLKKYVDDEGARTNQWLHRLTEAGFAPPNRLRVTPARWWSSAHRTQIADLARGSAWGTWLTVSDSEREESSIAVADWLTALQRLPVVLEDRTNHRSLPIMRKEATRLADAFPDASPTLDWIVEATSHHLNTEPSSLVASHGDLHLDELFVAPGKPLVVTGVDLDTAGLRRPSFDVGFALAMLLVSSWIRTGSFHIGASAGHAFWRRWAATGMDSEAVPAQIARSLVMSLHFELVAYRTGRVDLLPLWLDLAATAMSSGVEAILTQAEDIG